MTVVGATHQSILNYPASTAYQQKNVPARAIRSGHKYTLWTVHFQAAFTVNMRMSMSRNFSHRLSHEQRSNILQGSCAHFPNSSAKAANTDALETLCTPTCTHDLFN